MNTRRSFRRLLTRRPLPIDWEAVYRAELPRVYNFFRYRVGDDQLAEDLTSTTFERAWAARDRYQHDRAAFSTWLLTIARHLAIDHYRTRREAVALDALDDLHGDDSPEALDDDHVERDRLSQLLTALPDRDRDLLALKYGAAMTNREIAALTDLSESNVGTILHRVIERLRREWDIDDLPRPVQPVRLHVHKDRS